MRDKIVAKDKEHLRDLIREEMKKNGNQCDLNHIDVSNITNMTHLFMHSEFNGNISQWDVSNVTDIMSIFLCSDFTGDLSDWKPYNLKKPWMPFVGGRVPAPYWSKILDKDKRRKAIDIYHLNKELNQELVINADSKKKPKI